MAPAAPISTGSGTIRGAVAMYSIPRKTTRGGVQKTFPATRRRSARSLGLAHQMWCQVEMRVGQKNKLTYRWARKGSRPRATHDQRTKSTYLFGAVCAEHGTGAALVLPACNSEAMQLYLDEIATKVTPGAHVIVLLDQAGWYGTKTLKIPSNICCHCRRAHQNSTAWKISGSSCVKHADRPALENHVGRTPRLSNYRSFNLRISMIGDRQLPLRQCEQHYTTIGT